MDIILVLVVAISNIASLSLIYTLVGSFGSINWLVGASIRRHIYLIVHPVDIQQIIEKCNR